MLAIWPLHAMASLGGDAASVSSGGAAFQASLSTARASGYSVHILQLPSGTVVNEYVDDATGTVFGVAWRGPAMPDLKQLLGVHYADYIQNLHAKPGPAFVEMPGLVVRSSGHMRAFSGSAYLPRQLPKGVSPQAIQ
jgi:hypothetical protein